jgi:hypothetical protein
MAVNKPFANLDRLSKVATPQVQLPAKTVDQGSAKVNTNFANRISLADRLEQAKLGTTNHLPQYFLSDVFTNYIKIKQTKPVEHTSDVEIQAPTQSVVQGGVLPQIITFSPQQGGEIPKIAKSSFLYDQAAIERIGGADVSSLKLSTLSSIIDKTLQQGTFLQNAQFYSTIQPEVPPLEVEQGSADIQNLQTTPQQGSTESTSPVSVQSITLAQGTILINGQQTSFIDTSQPLVKRPIEVPYASLSLPSVVQNEAVAASMVPSSIVVNSNWFNGLDWQGKKSFTLIPEQGVELKTAGYLAKSLAFRILPTVMHGGNNPTNQLDRDGFAVTWNSHREVSRLLNAPDSFNLDPGTVISILQKRGASGFQKNSTLVGGGYKNVAVKSADGALFINVDPRPNESQQRQENVVKVLNKGDSSDVTKDIGDILRLPTPGREDKNAVSVNDKYVEVMANEKQGANDPGNGKNNNTLIGELYDNNKNVTKVLGDRTPDVTVINNAVTKLFEDRANRNHSFSKTLDANVSEKIYKTYQQLVNASENTAKQGDVQRPGATVTITAYDGSDSVVFDAFIKTFSDGVNPTYTDYTHIGQQDTFKVFKGSTRQLSLGLSVYAMGQNERSRDFTNSQIEAKAALRKVDKLMRLCGVGEVVGNYIKAPIIRITVAGLVRDLLCACNSVKLDLPITETAWDVDTQIPQSFDVSLDLAVLAMQGDKLLTRNGNFYNV